MVTLPIEAIYLGVVCLFALAWLARHRNCNCGKCAFHQNEYRVERLRKKDEEHDTTHRNWGNCGDQTCPRNTKRVN